MFKTYTHITILNPIPSLPRIGRIGHEIIPHQRYKRTAKTGSSQHIVFQYTLKGEGRISYGTQTWDVPTGYGFFGRYADPTMTYRKLRKEPWEFIYLNIFGGNIDDTVRELIDRYGPIFPLPLNSSTVAELHSYADAPGKDVTMPATANAALLHNLLAELVTNKLSTAPTKPSPLVLKAIEMIRDNLVTRITATELADMLGISREHLTRSFSNQLGLTPHEYIVKQKMRMACRLLESTRLTNIEIAEKLGDSSADHFARTFKRQLGMTPKQYRNSPPHS